MVAGMVSYSLLPEAFLMGAVRPGVLVPRVVVGSVLKGGEMTSAADGTVGLRRGGRGTHPHSNGGRWRQLAASLGAGLFVR